MDSFCLGIPINTITTDIIHAIKNNPLIIFYQAGNFSYVVWNVVLPVGCTYPTFCQWMSKAPWTELLNIFRRLNAMTGSSHTLTYGNIRVYLKYPIAIPESLRSTVNIESDMICFGIQLKNINENIINHVRNSPNLVLYLSGESFYLTHRISTNTGVLKPEFDMWFRLIDPITLLMEINHVLTSDNRDPKILADLRLYGKYQLTYPYASKIKFYT